MNNFKDFGIPPTSPGFIGDKIKIERIFNREIKVYDYKIKDSKVKEKTKCLHLQISIGENMHIIFTGSESLMDTIQMIPKDKFPFMTKIIKENEKYIFT